MGIVQKNGFWITVISYVGVAVGFVSAVTLFPRLLTTEELGLTNVLRSSGLLLAQLSALGGGNIVLRFFPFFKTDDQKYNGIFSFTFIISLIGILLFSLLFLFLKPTITQYYSSDSTLFAKYCLLSIPLSAFIVFYTLFSSWLRSMKKVVASAVYLEIALRCSTMISVLCYATGTISLDFFIWLFICSFSVPAIGLFLHCWRIGILSFDLTITDQIRRYFKPAIKYGLFCLFAGIGSSIVGNIDSLMLGMKGLESVAIYGIVLNFISVLQMPYKALMSISFPLVAEYWQQNDMIKMKELYQKFTLNIVIILLLLFSLIWVNIDTIYLIMPKIYATGKWAVLILFVGKFIDMSTGLNATILGTSAKYRWDLYFAIFLIISAVVTNYIFIPRYGIEGAALATSISIALLNIGKVLAVQKFFQMQPFTMRVFLITLGGGLVCYLISIIPAFSHWLPNILVRSLLVGLLFALPVYLLKISPDFNSMIHQIISRGRTRKMSK